LVNVFVRLFLLRSLSLALQMVFCYGTTLRLDLPSFNDDRPPFLCSGLPRSVSFAARSQLHSLSLLSVPPVNLVLPGQAEGKDEESKKSTMTKKY